VRGIIRESSQYARLQKQVMFAFSSKYALALYEMVQKRGNLKFKTSEEFPLDRFRSLLGVEPNKLREFKHFKNRAIDPAVLEVNGLGEFGCKVEPVYTGRKVTAIRLSWWSKNLDERKSTLNELRFSRVGRRARLQGKVETVVPLGILSAPPSQDVTVAPPIPKRDRSPALANGPFGREGGRTIPAGPRSSLPPSGRSGLTERQMERFRRDFPGLDVAWLERDFQAWVADKGPPKDYAAAFYGFMKRKKDEMNT
jgi:Initiator Replication protein